jgi:hypothetical protein
MSSNTTNSLTRPPDSRQPSTSTGS